MTGPELPAVGARVEVWPKGDPVVATCVGLEDGAAQLEVAGTDGVVSTRGTFWRPWYPTLRPFSMTLWRPWPLAILASTKRVENRPRRYPSLVGNLLALSNGLREDHAGAQRIRELDPDLFDLDPDLWELWNSPGHLVGVALVTEVRRYDPARDGSNPWASGPWLHILDKVVPLPEPVAFTGHQGLRAVPDPLATELEWLWRKGQQLCTHAWVDVSSMADEQARERCRRCGLERLVPWDAAGNEDA